MRESTQADLFGCDVRDGRLAYAACTGKGNDVTESLLWRGGLHQASHEAGRDLTEPLRLRRTARNLRKNPPLSVLKKTEEVEGCGK